MATLTYEPPIIVLIGNTTDLLAHTCGGHAATEERTMLTLKKTIQKTGSWLGQICYGDTPLTSAYGISPGAIDEWFAKVSGRLIDDLAREQASAVARISLCVTQGEEPADEDLRIVALPVGELVALRTPAASAGPPEGYTDAPAPELPGEGEPAPQLPGEEAEEDEDDAEEDGEEDDEDDDGDADDSVEGDETGEADENLSPDPGPADTIVASPEVLAGLAIGNVMGDLAREVAERIVSAGPEAGAPLSQYEPEPPPPTLQAQNPDTLPTVGQIIEVREWNGPWLRAKVTTVVGQRFEAEALDDAGLFWASESGRPWRYFEGSEEETPPVPMPVPPAAKPEE